jgi:hypothetical protein
MLPHSSQLAAGHSPGLSSRRPHRRIDPSIAILAAFAVETLSVTWALKIPGAAPYLSIPYFISGICIALLLLYFPVVRLPAAKRTPWKDPIHLYRLFGVAMIALVLYSWCAYWFDEMPLDISNADMLPIIKVMGHRFIAGQHSHIYDPIPSIWHGVQPIYLPAMWLPYVPAIFLEIDMRWVAVAGLLFAFSIFLFLYRPPALSPSALASSHLPDAHPDALRQSRTRNYVSLCLGFLAFLLFWWMVADNTAGLVSVAEEGVVIAYYVMLVLALLSRRVWLIGVAASLCMMSRYALVGWIPAFLLYLVMEKRGKDLFIFILTGLLCFVLLFLLPVGWPTFLRLAGLPGHYVDFAGRVWHDSPDTFSTAPGFAWFFGPNRIAALHWTLITLSFVTPLVFVIVCGFLNRKTAARNRTSLPHGPAAPLANIPLATLKLSLVVFYCFIDVPYLYLFYTSSVVSLIILALLHGPRYASSR